MENIERLKVQLQFAEAKIDVGELVQANRKIYFKYYPSFLESSLDISPIRLPRNTEILSSVTSVFDGLFGVFHDSLPDAWGRLLLDRALLSRGIDSTRVNVLDRLAFVGNGGMGALCYYPPNPANQAFMDELDLDGIAANTQGILEGTSFDIIEELFQWGGSSGGARPKIFVSYHPEKDRLKPQQASLPAGFEHWIIKFPSSNDPNDIAEIEYAYYLMAIEAGLEMNICKLFYGQSGKAYFGTKRFDRNHNHRLHMHSAAGLMHDNFRYSSMDYGHLMDAAFQLEKNVNAYIKVLRLAAFNVFAHNRDDHSKNVSFLMNVSGEWKLAPAYDLTFSQSSHGFHSMTVAGNGESPGKKELMELASVFKVNKPNQIIEQVQDAIAKWPSFAQQSGIPEKRWKEIQRHLNV